MTTVINKTKRPIPLPSGHKLQPGENKGIPQSVRNHKDNKPFLDGEEAAGRVEFAANPLAVPRKARGIDPKPDPATALTREALASMSRKALEEIGEAHGLRPADMKALNVEDGPKGIGLRTVVSGAVFVDL